MSWDYGPEGAEFPVRPGSAWRVGRHVWLCGSLVSCPRVTADLFYCDPPWNNGILRTFQRNTGASEALSWQDIYKHAIFLAAGRPLFIEGGEKQAAEVYQMLSLPGLIVRQWPITYSRGTRPCVLSYCGPPNVAAYGDPSGLDDADTPAWVMSRLPSGLVADLTAGRGITSRCAEACDWASFNIELDGRRVSAALARLARLTGERPAEVEGVSLVP